MCCGEYGWVSSSDVKNTCFLHSAVNFLKALSVKFQSPPLVMDSKDTPASTVAIAELVSRPISVCSTKNSSPTSHTSDVEKVAPSEPAPPYSAFSHSRQWSIVLIVTAAGFFSPLTGAIYLPSLILFESVFHTSSTDISASVSVYWAVFAIAPMFGATLSNYGGRKTIYVSSLAVFLVANTLVANTLVASVPPTVGGLFTLRIFQVGFRYPA